MGACYHEKYSGCRQHAGGNGVAICRYNVHVHLYAITWRKFLVI